MLKSSSPALPRRSRDSWSTTRPDAFCVQRTASVNAPPEAIFPLINDLRNGEQWSPYYRKDPAMKTLVPRGEATEVTWAIQGRQPYLAKLEPQAKLIDQ